jgi:DNA-directed RNA polymerase specialized sigma24 family protein
MSKAQIMRKAWSLYNEITTAAPECRSRAQFALCLKEAHRIANTAANARREWEQLTGAQQFEALTRMTWAVRKRAEATGRGIDTEWIRTPDDAQTVAADAWPRVLSALDRNDQREDPRPLVFILYAACTQAAHSISRAEIRHVSACISADAIAAATPDTNNGQSLLDIRSSCTAAPISGDPEEGYTIRAAIDAAAAGDDATREIIARLAAGYTVRDIAAAIGMSKSAVQRRIDKVRAAYLAQMQA